MNVNRHCVLCLQAQAKYEVFTVLYTAGQSANARPDISKQRKHMFRLESRQSFALQAAKV